jgi:hypothetical protein
VLKKSEKLRGNENVTGVEMENIKMKINMEEECSSTSYGRISLPTATYT